LLSLCITYLVRISSKVYQYSHEGKGKLEDVVSDL